MMQATSNMQPALVHSLVDSFFESKKAVVKQRLRDSIDSMVDDLFGELVVQVKQLLLPMQYVPAEPEASMYTVRKSNNLFASSSSPIMASTTTTKSPPQKSKFFKSHDSSQPPIRATKSRAVSPCSQHCNFNHQVVNQADVSSGNTLKRPQIESNQSVKRARSSTSSNTNDRPFICPRPQCGKTFKQNCDLKRHERAHLQVKPYHCKWPGCSYASGNCGDAMRHVRLTHFRRSSKPGEHERAAKWDPKVYIEVDRELLNEYS